VEGVDGRGLRQRSVLHVVDRHAVDLAGPRKRRLELHGGERDALLARGRLLEARAITVELLDQARHDVPPVTMRDLGHEGGDVHDAIVAQDPDLEVTEIRKLHRSLPDGFANAVADERRPDIVLPDRKGAVEGSVKGAVVWRSLPAKPSEPSLAVFAPKSSRNSCQARPGAIREFIPCRPLVGSSWPCGVRRTGLVVVRP
jgi:hypothetical protein